jgi:hypothetical protein
MTIQSLGKTTAGVPSDSTNGGPEYSYEFDSLAAAWSRSSLGPR